MHIKEAISRIVDREDLSTAEMEAVMQQIMTGEATPIQIGGFLAGLRAKGETVEEIAAAARVMRALASKVEIAGPHVVDTCGTGGDGASLFNVSTACAFVVAAAGGKVAKHGNRSMSSKSGSADVLEALGVNIEQSPEQVQAQIGGIGVGFLFAPAHHSAARHAAAPRKELGTRTLFNLLGPITNPASAPHQLLGVFAARWVEPMAKVLRELGSKHVLVVHAEDGLDEISLAVPTRVAELQDGQVRTYRIQPEDVGIQRQSMEALSVDGPEASATMILDVFANTPGPALEMVVLNAGAAIYAADLVPTFREGVDRARELIASGAVLEKLEALREATGSTS
ncbi:MAG: anthranilate phosphoribosyltransferase [Gammaproteobacteria bacterium]|nr:anthranilate phosphoribosyltransferase [Gammaproteobacteria bacterium]